MRPSSWRSLVIFEGAIIIYEHYRQSFRLSKNSGWHCPATGISL
ncbi:MAG: hypothetical protein DYG89_09735 [Caldilinea sp. CFX5]|nr:hypothetical protein [Caldilinea sp. CFX5]